MTLHTMLDATFLFIFVSTERSVLLVSSQCYDYWFVSVFDNKQIGGVRISFAIIIFVSFDNEHLTPGKKYA